MTVFCCSEADCNCEVIERILQLSSKAALWISSESREMFDNYPSDHLNISDEYMSEAAKDDFCFTTSIDDICKHEDRIEMVILYRYKGEADYSENLRNWSLIKSDSFESGRRELIKEEFFVRR